jgi:hypothetical protein
MNTLYIEMKITRYIDFSAFLISFAVGMFFVYTTFDDRRKIVVYPTPENVEHVLYRDQTNQCFAFHQKEVTCPSNSAQISKIPVQA